MVKHHLAQCALFDFPFLFFTSFSLTRRTWNVQIFQMHPDPGPVVNVGNKKRLYFGDLMCWLDCRYRQKGPSENSRCSQEWNKKNPTRTVIKMMMSLVMDQTLRSFILSIRLQIGPMLAFMGPYKDLVLDTCYLPVKSRANIYQSVTVFIWEKLLLYNPTQTKAPEIK